MAQGFAVHPIIIFAVLYSGGKSRCPVHCSCLTSFTDLDLATENVALTYLISACYWLGRCADDTYSKFRGDSDIVCLFLLLLSHVELNGRALSALQGVPYYSFRRREKQKCRFICSSTLRQSVHTLWNCHTVTYYKCLGDLLGR